MKIAAACVVVLGVTACGGASDSRTTGGFGGTGSGQLQLPGPAAEAAVDSIPVCPGPVALGDAHCHSRVVVDQGGSPLATTSPSGYGPSDLQSAYALPSATAGAGQTIAIVDAYDDPTAKSDLDVYRSTYGLAPIADCSSGAHPCFLKVNQSGGSTMPRGDHGWALEISLDLQMASAICPNCDILLVEASSNSMANLGTAVNYAAAHAGYVSNSYGGAEFKGEASYDASYYQHAGKAITVSSGDGGYGVEFPAAGRYVIAVGGTSLKRDSSARGWGESAWNGAGSGCSAYIAKPSWQKDAGCANRTVADVSAVADPNTGVAVYDSYGYYGRKGWFQIGGTSVSAPIVAAVYALAGDAASTTSPASTPYGAASSLFDVKSGSNGSCGGSYLCTAGTGYDGPTGLGTPDGTGAF